MIAVAAFFGYDYLFADDNGYPQLPLEEYYAGAEGLDGEELKNFLTELVSTNVTLVSYADAKVALAEADADPDNPGKVLTIYSRASVPALWDGSSWHREHVWPNSRLGVERVNEHEKNQASDLHNLRAIQPSVNSSRGNKVFSDETGPETYYPGDEDKGDVARILFYMVIRYPEFDLVEETRLTIRIPTTRGRKNGGLICLLGGTEDLPDDFEKQRNDVIYRWQNNRNLIDHPEFVEMIFGD